MGDPRFCVGPVEPPSGAASAAAARIQENSLPAILVWSVLPRSGSVYTAELLHLHPEVHAFPNEVWEHPFLKNLHHLMRFRDAFFRDYAPNRGRIGENDFLSLFGASFMAYLKSFAPEGIRILLKEPSVDFLAYAPIVFPLEDSVVVLRDGRDVVASTLRTWPETDFGKACHRWERSCRLILKMESSWSEDGTDPLLVRFEDVVRLPEEFVRTACERFELDPNRYPFHRIESLPVLGSSTLSPPGKVTWAPTRKPPGFNPVGHWHSWPPERKDRFKEIAGEMLIEAGYEENHQW
jgi:hypothetical protein